MRRCHTRNAWFFCTHFVVLLLWLTAASSIAVSHKLEQKDIIIDDENVGGGLLIEQECIHKGTDVNRSLLLVSDMDGAITALDIADGKKLWSLRAGSKLISSSISSLEVIYNGIPTRLVPSLDGTLFRFYDDMFEPVPFTADTLLSSSFRLAGDATVVGSKDITSSGLDPICGRVYYNIGKDGCVNTEVDPQTKLILVVKHVTHTVRAASVRTGIEKWNFSVGYLDLKIVEPVGDEHYSTRKQENTIHTKTSHNLKFDVQDGLILKYNQKKSPSASLQWSHQFSSPISKAWILKSSDLQQLDLFDPSLLLLPDELGASSNDKTSSVLPSLFIGVFDQQIYVQSSKTMRKAVSNMAYAYRKGNFATPVPRVKWKPLLASAPSRTPWLNYGKPDPTMMAANGDSQLSALSLLHPALDYPYDTGFYLFSDILDTDSDNESEPMVGNDDIIADLEEMLHVQIVSLSYYWREVVLISVVFAFVVNFIIYVTRRHRRLLKKRLIGKSNDDDDGEISDVDVEQKKPKVQIEEVTKAIDLYTSRYQSDFLHVQCLGKGGFGVVFQSQNKLDECDYAVKRITLPNSDEAKEKVTREVKALAKLDHTHIVRYFQSWFETPPPGWQEDQDKQWEESEGILPTPCNSVLNVKQFKAAGKPIPEEDLIPQLRFDKMRDISISYGFSHAADNSVDIVFATEESAQSSTNSEISRPFFNYTGSEDSSSSSQSIIEEDSGCHNEIQIGSTKSFDVQFTEIDASLQNLSLEESHQGTRDTQETHTNKPRKSSLEPEAKLFLYIQMQLCKRDTLRDYLNANTLNRNRAEMLDIFLQICAAVEYIHSQGLIHRDLKPTNIFFSTEDTIKVGDFGLVTALSAFPEEGIDTNTEATTQKRPSQYYCHTDHVGTQLYMSPEQIAGRMYNSRVDIYALGLIFFELMYPFSTSMERIDTLSHVKKMLIPERFERELPKESKFVKWMLAVNPKHRPSITDILNSPFMEKVKSDSASRHRSRTISRSSN